MKVMDGLNSIQLSKGGHNLLDIDPVFRELIRHPRALELVLSLLGEAFLISNFTANIARPGARSMPVHSDQALVTPEPWLHPWAMNVIWCLDDVHEGNGATRYVPGSPDYKSFDDVPADIDARSVAWEAPAGSIIAMDGRMWHTSGYSVRANPYGCRPRLSHGPDNRTWNSSSNR